MTQPAAEPLEARIREIVRLANRRGYVEDLIVTEILALLAEEQPNLEPRRIIAYRWIRADGKILLLDPAEVGVVLADLFPDEQP